MNSFRLLHNQIKFTQNHIHWSTYFTRNAKRRIFNFTIIWFNIVHTKHTVYWFNWLIASSQPVAIRPPFKDNLKINNVINFQVKSNFQVRKRKKNEMMRRTISAYKFTLISCDRLVVIKSDANHVYTSYPHIIELLFVGRKEWIRIYWS